jgi:hypothetical protein
MGKYTAYKNIYYEIFSVENVCHKAYVYGLLFLSSDFCRNKSYCEILVKENIDKYIESCNKNLIEYARPVPFECAMYNQNKLWHGNREYLLKNETMKLSNAFEKFGYKEIFGKTLGGLMLYFGSSGYEIDFSKFLLRTDKIRPGERFFHLPALPIGHHVRARFDNIYRVFFVDNKRNLGLVSIEYDVEKIRYGDCYLFEYLVDGKVEGVFGIKIKNNGLSDICEIKSFGYPDFSTTFSVNSSLIDDFNAVNSFMSGVKRLIDDFCFEKFKFYISLLLRYIIQNEPNDKEIEFFLNENTDGNFLIFLTNFNIIYKNIDLSKNISSEYFQNKILSVYLCKKYGCDEYENSNIEDVFCEIAKKESVDKEEFDLILDFFRCKNINCVGLKDKKNYKSKDDVCVLLSKLVWSYVAKNYKDLSQFCFIANLKIDGFSDEEIYKLFIENEKYLGKNIYEIFGVKSDKSRPSDGGKFIATLWDKVFDVAQEKFLPKPCIPRLLRE